MIAKYRQCHRSSIHASDRDALFSIVDLCAVPRRLGKAKFPPTKGEVVTPVYTVQQQREFLALE